MNFLTTHASLHLQSLVRCWLVCSGKQTFFLGKLKKLNSYYTMKASCSLVWLFKFDYLYLNTVWRVLIQCHCKSFLCYCKHVQVLLRGYVLFEDFLLWIWIKLNQIKTCSKYFALVASLNAYRSDMEWSNIRAVARTYIQGGPSGSQGGGAKPIAKNFDIYSIKEKYFKNCVK